MRKMLINIVTSITLHSGLVIFFYVGVVCSGVRLLLLFFYLFLLCNHFARIFDTDLFERGERCWKIVFVFTMVQMSVCAGCFVWVKPLQTSVWSTHLCWCTSVQGLCAYCHHTLCLIFIARDAWNSWHCGKIKQLLLSVSWCI